MRTGLRWGFVSVAIMLVLFLFYQTHVPYWTLSPAGRELVRLHIIAHSDHPRDQALKLKVRDRIIEQTAALFTACESPREAEQALRDHLNLVQQVSDQALAEAGTLYKSQVELGAYPFPGRTYRDLYLPAGQYRALKIVLGAGNGCNWWCVLFPPLCFVDGASGIEATPVTEKRPASAEESQPVMTGSGWTVEKPAAVEDSGEKVEIRFKVVEIWKRVRPGTLLSLLSKE